MAAEKVLQDRLEWVAEDCMTSDSALLLLKKNAIYDQ